MAKFKVGDYITSIEGYRGFEDAIVTYVDDKEYRLKIPCGSATMLIKMDDCYKLKIGPKRLIK